MSRLRDEKCWHVPISWKWVPFSDVVDISSKLVKPDEVSNLPHIAPDNIQSGSAKLLPFKTIGEDGVISPKHHFLPGQVLYSKIRPYLRKAVLVDFEGGCSADMYPLTASGGLDPRYLLNWLISNDFTDFAVRHQGRTVLPKINQDALNHTPLPLPPLAEQKRIVAKLDALNAKSARARTELARIETLVSRYKQAVLSKAFSGRLSHSRARFGEFIQTSGNGLSKREGDDGEWTNVLRLTDLDQGQFSPEAPRQIRLTHKEVEKYRMTKGELVIIRVNGSANLVGRSFCFKAEDLWAFCDHFIRVRLKPTFDPDFAAFFLNSPPIRSIIEHKFVSTSGQKTINQKTLEELPAPQTSIQEQHDIVRRIESAFAKIDRLAVEAKRALKLVGKLDEAILAKAFRGELVPQDENDEPADRLLARTRAERQAAPKAKRGRRAKA